MQAAKYSRCRACRIYNWKSKSADQMAMLLRHLEFGRQFHSFGFRHLRGDLLQGDEALMRKSVGSRSSSSALKPGIRRSCAPASRTSAGMIFSTAWRLGMCRTARRCSRCRSWAVCRVRRWCAVKRTSWPITSRLTRNVWMLFVPLRSKTWHKQGTVVKASEELLSRRTAQGLVPAVGIEPTTNGLQNRCSTN